MLPSSGKSCMGTRMPEGGRSLWAQTASLPSFPPLEGDVQTDVLIIGGGMAGLLCAYRLQQAGVAYMLVEAGTVASGVTRFTTAKITAQHGLCYDKLIRQRGREKARLYLEANQKALTQYRTLCRRWDCDFQETDAYVYSRGEVGKLQRELKALRSLGAQAVFLEQLPLPFAVSGAVCLRHQGQFHPLKFLSHLVQDLHIYEHTAVRGLSGHKADTDRGRITAKKIIMAAHFPFIDRHGSYFLKMYQHRSYVLALEHAPHLEGMYVEDTHSGLSFRNYGDLLLVGGGGHRTGLPGGGFGELEQFANLYYPKARVRFGWATQDCMTLDGIPYIGQYSMATPDWYVATGFNKWGMTTSMVAADLLTDLVCGRKNELAALFSPSRSMLHVQLARNSVQALKGWVSPNTRRCTHLGCTLKWNPEENTWDCPCHGSRFTPEGHRIDNPATRDLP